MLEEYALTPDIFDPAAYSNPAYADMCLAHLKEPLLREVLVRDLRNGDWSRHCLQLATNQHRLAGEILRKLSSNNRLCRHPASGAVVPTSAEDWCHEALATHPITPLDGVIVAHATKQTFAQPQVACIEKLAGTNWWQGRASSQIIDRKTTDYLRSLDRIHRQANSLMFIDPNIDPSRQSWQEFDQLLAPLKSRNPLPRIELHRSFCRGDGPDRTLPTVSAWRQSFEALHKALGQKGLSCEVFFWQDFHDRYLITDIIGLQAGAGFDVTKKTGDQTTWSRLGFADRDNWQRKFDPASRPADLKFRFRIGSV